MGMKGNGTSMGGAGRKGEWPMWREEHELQWEQPWRRERPACQGASSAHNHNPAVV